MAVFALCSTNGGPGVSTTALGLAMCWPRPTLLVEADPRGLSALLTGWFQGSRPYETGLVELALSALAPQDALRDIARQIPGTTVSYVAGLRSHAQAPVLRGAWAGLAGALADLEVTGTDVIVDAGALGVPGSPEPLLEQADVTVLVVRSSLPALAGARPWADVVVRNDPWRAPGVLVVGEGRPYSTAEVGRALDLPVIGHVAWDPDAAEVYYAGATPPRKFATGAYVRSLRATASALIAHVTYGRQVTDLALEESRS